MPDDYIYPEAYQALSVDAFEQAFALNNCVHWIKMARLHGAPESLTPEQKEQRGAILGIAAKILEADRDRAMDKAVAHWQKFRRMTK